MPLKTRDLRGSDWHCQCGAWNSPVRNQVERKTCGKCARVALPAHRFTRAKLADRAAQGRITSILRKHGLSGSDSEG